MRASISVEDLQGLVGHGKVVTDRGEKVGSIGEIYVDDATGAPDWVTVRTGLLGAAESFVPLGTARIDGHDLVVAHAKDVIEDAPRIEVDGFLSPQEEQLLYRHYGVASSDQVDRSVQTTDAPQTTDAAQTTDATLTRSEERLVVGTQQREAGRARLRKYVVTERVTQTVPLRHQEVRLTREPITDSGATATPASAFAEEDYEVVLLAETPVVEKTVVPVERVRLDTVTVTGQETVSADLRKELIEVDDPTSKARRTTGTTTGTTTGSSGDTSTRSTPGTAKSTPGTAKSTPGTAKSTPGTAKSPSKGKKGNRRRR